MVLYAYIDTCFCLFVILKKNFDSCKLMILVVKDLFIGICVFDLLVRTRQWRERLKSDLG